MKLTKNQQIVLIIMIIVIGIIIYNLYFTKNEYASSIPYDQNLESVKYANNIKNKITSDDTKNLNESNIFILASNVINQIQYLFFIYNNNLGMVKVNLSTGMIESSRHVTITQESTKVIFKISGDLVILNINVDKILYATNTVNKKFDTLTIQFDSLKLAETPYLLFRNTNTNEQTTYFIDRFLDDINIFLNADMVENNLPIQVKVKIQNYLTEYKSTPTSPTTISQNYLTEYKSSPTSPTSWKCINIPSYNNTMAIKLNENGDPQCYSKDGKSCWWGQCDNFEDARSVTCTPTGNMFNSYDSSDTTPNWCTYSKNNYNNIETPALVPEAPTSQNTYYNLNCNIDFNNRETPVIKNCSVIKYN
jgi:hypothetical protein